MNLKGNEIEKKQIPQNGEYAIYQRCEKCGSYVSQYVLNCL